MRVVSELREPTAEPNWRANTRRDPDTHAAHADAQPHANADAGSDTAAHTFADGKPHADAHTDAGRNARADADTGHTPRPDADADTRRRLRILAPGLDQWGRDQLRAPTPELRLP